MRKVETCLTWFQHVKWSLAEFSNSGGATGSWLKSTLGSGKTECFYLDVMMQKLYLNIFTF